MVHALLTRGKRRPPQKGDIRCSNCHVLLGQNGPNGLTIERCELQATIDGRFQVVLVCYRRDCRTLNIFKYGDEQAIN